MGIGNIPFPSFTLLLTSDRVVIPGPSYAIRLAPLVFSHSHVPQDMVFTPTTNNYDFGDETLLANVHFKDDLTTTVALVHSHPEELAYGVSETSSMPIDETGSVRTTGRGHCRQVEEDVRARTKFAFPFLKKRQISRFSLKNILKGLSLFTDK